jgi:hypothetical protein
MNKEDMMRFFLSCLIVAIGLVAVAPAQETQEQKAEKTDKPARSSKFSIGFGLETLQDDFGMELALTTPYFANGVMAFRVRGGIAWASGIPEGETKEDWLLYAPVRIAYTVSSAFAADRIRLYSEGGSILIFSIQDVASETYAGAGGYGLFGFEFFANDYVPVTYFIEGGGMGTNSEADKMISDPSLGNGFFVSVGIRWYP